MSRNDGRAVAVTGLGIISSIGLTADEVTQALYEGRSGVVLDPQRAEAGFRSGLTGRINGFDPRTYGCSAKMLRTMCEPAQYAWAAATTAVSDAGLAGADLQSDRVGIIFGNDSAVKPAVEAVDVLRSEGETHFIGAGNIFRVMNSTVSMNLASALGIRGASWTLSAACASGAHALGQAVMLIRAGLQDMVLAGGAQETDWHGMMSFDALGAFSQRTSEPEEASRPFDADRDGLVPSGGGACLVLESAERARARGARIYGFITGYGFSTDGSGHLSRPESSAAARSMKMALGDAGIGPSQVDYVNAHAASTPLGDRAEAEAVFEVFGSDVPVSSTKSMTGHECWMAGASEVIYAILMARRDFIAGNINFSRLDADCPRINVIKRTVDRTVRRAVSNSFGFGGTNATIVLDFDCGQPQLGVAKGL